jgi:molecular chaperone GrpE
MYKPESFSEKDTIMPQDEQEQQKSGGRSEGESPAQEEEAQSAAVADKVEQQLRAEQQRAEEYLDLLRRTQADFINYRRRMSQEQAETRTTAQIALLAQLLPVLDDFERALQATPPDLAEQSWVQGLGLVERRLTALLEQLGVHKIGTRGEPFDPRQHEALTVEERADVPEGTILQVARQGYALGERVIRPAQVIVAGAPSPVSGATE